MTIQEQSQYPRPPQLNLRAVAVLVLAMIMSPLPLYAISVLALPISQEVTVTRVRLGTLATLMFVVSGLGSRWVGKRVDRYGPGPLLNCLFAASAASLLTISLSLSFSWMVVAIVLGGGAASIANPATTKMISRHGKPAVRGVLIGVVQSGIQISQFLVGMALPLVALAVGWRSAIAAALVLPLVGIIGVVAVLRRWQDRARMVMIKENHKEADRLRWLWLYTFLMGTVIQATNVHLPLYAAQSVGLSLVSAGRALAVAGLIGVVARIFWGWMMRDSARYVRILGYLGLGSGVSIVLIALAAAYGEIWLWLGVASFGATALCSMMMAMTTVLAITSTEGAGTASATTASGMYAGFAVGPIMVGTLVDYAGDYWVGWLVLIAACLTATITSTTRGGSAPSGLADSFHP